VVVKTGKGERQKKERGKGGARGAIFIPNQTREIAPKRKGKWLKPVYSKLT
jgi:hypothetical protein